MTTQPNSHQALYDMVRQLDNRDGGAGWLTAHHNVTPLIATAREWLAAGFTARAATSWIDAGGFDPQRCREMEDAGIDASMAAQSVPDSLDEGISTSYAYAYSNNDLSLVQIVDALGVVHAG